MGSAPPSALIYCRVSTQRQEEQGSSLETQEEACLAHAATLGYRVHRVFRETYTGHDLVDRPVLSELRQEVRTRQHAAVIVYSTDRFSRKQGITFVLLYEWEPYGVELISVTDPLDKTAQGKFMMSAREFIAEVERDKIRERTMRGKRARVRGTAKDPAKVQNWGFPPYGYHLNETGDKRVIYEPEAAIVRRIFSLCLEEQLGLVAIARRLNREGIPSPGTGKRMRRDPAWEPHWGTTQVRRILDRTDYKGEAYALLHAVPGDDGEKVEPVPLPADASPAIVSPETWDAAHALLDRRSGEYRPEQHARHLLTGMIYCAVCGRPMYYEPHSGRDVKEYRCSSRVTYQGRCSGTPVRADDAMPRDKFPRRPDGKVRKPTPEERAELATIPGIERAVWDHVSAILSHPDVLIAELERQRNAAPDDRHSDDIHAARRALAKLDQQQAKLVRRFSESAEAEFPWDLVEREITRLEREKATIQTSIDQLEDRVRQDRIAADQLASLAEYLERVQRNLQAFDAEERHWALEMLGMRVYASGRDWRLEWGNVRWPVQDSSSNHPGGRVAGYGGAGGARARARRHKELRRQVSRQSRHGESRSRRPQERGAVL